MTERTISRATAAVRPSAPDIALKAGAPPTHLPHMNRKPPEPVPPRINIDDPSIDLGSIANVQLLSEAGELKSHPQFAPPDLNNDELIRVYRAMVLTRKLDERMLRMQRQGEMGTFAPGYGQEATQIGQVYPLTSRDWFSPSYRSFGAQMWRGWPIDQLMLLWDGFFEGFAPPDGVNDLPFSIVIGSHVPLATGVAMAARRCGDKIAVVVNFGDGAFSQGIVSESLNFAAVDRAPVVFVCENNGYAISVPVQKQSGNQVMAARGVGYDIPAYRVDGNDVLAMIAVCSHAVERARAGHGPALIEAITYRMSLHTTADDPKVYRSEEEVEGYRQRCPIARFEQHLQSRGVLDDAAIERIAQECERQVLDGREKFRSRANANPREVFDFVYEELPPELREQQAEYLAKLKRKGVQ